MGRVEGELVVGDVGGEEVEVGWECGVWDESVFVQGCVVCG